METIYNVFVYGTLKEGFPNFKINKGKLIRGHYCTQKAYALYLVGERFVPWLVLDGEKISPIKGELFEVSETTLADMDILEQTAQTEGYQRVEVDILDQESGKNLKAYLYGKHSNQLIGQKIQHKLNDEYTTEHAKHFIPRQP